MRLMPESKRHTVGIGSAAAEPLLAFAAEHLGSILKVTDMSWPHAESHVLAVVGARNRAVLKVHRQGRKFNQELSVYREWLPLIGSSVSQSAATPRLLAVREEYPRALLIEWVDGQLLGSSVSGEYEHVLTNPATEQEFHRRAGAWLGALHSLELVDEDPVTLEQAYVQRLETWSARAVGVLSNNVIANVDRYARQALPVVRKTRRVRCHRDFTPRNWLVSTVEDQPERLTIIDFEHSIPDLYLVDMQRMWPTLWQQRPDLRQAFFEGYGRVLSDEEEGALKATMAMWGLTTAVWAREHGDVQFEQDGLHALRLLGLA